MENNLPRGWETPNLGEVVNITSGNSSLTKKIYKEDGKYIAFSGSGPDGKVDFFEEEGDAIILSAVGARCGKCFRASGKWTTIANTSIIRSFIDNSNHIDFLFYLLNNENFWPKGGSGQPFVQTGKAQKETKIPLPPLAEQQRIVAKLDALFEKIESNKKRLDKIPLILKRFRQSVLAAAVSGKLTEDWREKNNLKEWAYERAEETCELITKGTTPKNNGLTTIGEIPFLKVYNIVDQKIDFNYKPQYVSNEIHNNFLKRSRVYPGDVLMNIVGPPLGKVAIVPDTFEEWNINQAIAFFRAKEIVLPEFIYIILCEGSPITEIEKEYRGTAGQSNISLEQCRNFLFPLPEIEEQKEIVRRVKQLFAFADKLEARYNKAKAMLDKVPQSILAKAFRGELVSQNPDDEPASVLLERIKSEKEKLKAVKNTRKKK
jgi:type I restriction enzyme, S subunit